MQIIVDIPEDAVKLIEECIKFDNMVDIDVYDIVLNGIKNGTPLPKGHGRLIDADELRQKWIFGKSEKKEIDDAPTIIEADEEVEK